MGFKNIKHAALQNYIKHIVPIRALRGLGGYPISNTIRTLEKKN